MKEKKKGMEYPRGDTNKAEGEFFSHHVRRTQLEEKLELLKTEASQLCTKLTGELRSYGTKESLPEFVLLLLEITTILPSNTGIFGDETTSIYFSSEEVTEAQKRATFLLGDLIDIHSWKINKSKVDEALDKIARIMYYKMGAFMELLNDNFNIVYLNTMTGHYQGEIGRISSFLKGLLSKYVNRSQELSQEIILVTSELVGYRTNNPYEEPEELRGIITPEDIYIQMPYNLTSAEIGELGSRNWEEIVAATNVEKLIDTMISPTRIQLPESFESVEMEDISLTEAMTRIGESMKERKLEVYVNLICNLLTTFDLFILFVPDSTYDTLGDLHDKGELQSISEYSPIEIRITADFANLTFDVRIRTTKNKVDKNLGLRMLETLRDKLESLSQKSSVKKGLILYTIARENIGRLLDIFKEYKPPGKRLTVFAFGVKYRLGLISMEENIMNIVRRIYIKDYKVNIFGIFRGYANKFLLADAKFKTFAIFGTSEQYANHISETVDTNPLESLSYYYKYNLFLSLDPKSKARLVKHKNMRKNFALYSGISRLSSDIIYDYRLIEDGEPDYIVNPDLSGRQRDMENVLNNVLLEKQHNEYIKLLEETGDNRETIEAERSKNREERKLKTQETKEKMKKDNTNFKKRAREKGAELLARSVEEFREYEEKQETKRKKANAVRMERYRNQKEERVLQNEQRKRNLESENIIKERRREENNDENEVIHHQNIGESVVEETLNSVTDIGSFMFRNLLTNMARSFTLRFSFLKRKYHDSVNTTAALNIPNNLTDRLIDNFLEVTCTTEGVLHLKFITALGGDSIELGNMTRVMYAMADFVKLGELQVMTYYGRQMNVIECDVYLNSEGIAMEVIRVMSENQSVESVFTLVIGMNITIKDIQNKKEILNMLRIFHPEGYEMTIFDIMNVVVTKTTKQGDMSLALYVDMKSVFDNVSEKVTMTFVESGNVSKIYTDSIQLLTQKSNEEQITVLKTVHSFYRSFSEISEDYLLLYRKISLDPGRIQVEISNMEFPTYKKALDRLSV